VTAHFLLDASALLALLRQEPGSEKVAAVLDDSQIHTVNIAEVTRKLFAKGVVSADVEAALGELNLETIDEIGPDLALRIGEVAAANRHIGLSLGDAVCLTVAAWFNLQAVTADRRWQECAWPAMASPEKRPEILVIR
jgi:PIN domain nuclease of toxin-antitoxin system